MKTNITDLQKVSIGLMQGSVGNYSIEEGNELIRKVIIDACDGEWNMYKFQANKYKVFEIIAEVLTLPVGRMVEESFGRFANIERVPLNTKKQYVVKDPSLFKSYIVSAGNQDIRRQKLYNSKFEVITHREAIKIYAELDDFISGTIDFPEMVQRVALSFNNMIAKAIYSAVHNAYTGAEINATGGASGLAWSGTVTEANLMKLITRVEGRLGVKCAIYGTNASLSLIPIQAVGASEDMKSQQNSVGYVGKFRGRDCIELPQTATEDIADDFLIIAPVGTQMVYVVLEGDAYVIDSNSDSRNDMQMEYFFGQQFGVTCLKANNFGIWEVSGS